ncbi:PAS domain S-box protein [Paracraurococcus lichenis]|uniref:histidine kinase n=1 Tax=Paracraurococcus lichenis TaxID=3064888 RepID=A0ABT9E7Q4_9PROT|nr:PAS domain S-box protein [Paracraurococcus sp. LOR1-02]MDO9712236.1 PAS domain S-box protein [Paracraurococcus sp. LOR1-02]
MSSVRGRLLLLAGAMALPLIVLSGTSTWYAYSVQRHQREAALVGRAQAAAMVDREFDASFTAMRMLAGSAALARGDLDGFDEETRRASVQLGGVLINLTAASGEMALTTFWPPGLRKPGVRASEFLLSALRDNRASVSDLVVGPQTRRQQVGIALPVPSEAGGPAWMLSLYLPIDRLAQNLERLHLPPGWLASILDRQNRIVARTRKPEEFIGQQPPPDMLEALARADAGLIDDGHRAADGVPSLTVFARAPETGYVAAIGIPEAEFTAPLRAALWRAGGVATLLTALGLGGALVLSRRIVGAFRRVAETPPGFVPRTGLREIDELAKAAAEADARRRDSEARLEMAAEAGGIGIWDWNLLDNSFVYCERAKAICGFAAGTPVTYDMVRDVTHPEDFPITSAMCQRALDPALRESVPYEYRIRRSDGEVRWVLAHGSAIFAEHGGGLRAVRYLGTIQDITARKRAEQAVQESESRLRLAVDAGRMAVWEYDVAADQIVGSPALYRLLGFADGVTPTIEEVRGRYAPGERDRLRSIGQAALERGERFFEAEHGYLWPDGSLHWLALRAELVMQHGLPVRVVGVVMDVTDRKRAEAELRENEAMLRELLATIDLASVFIREWDGGIRFWSRGCERLYGWTAAEAVGRSVHDLLRVVFPVPLSEIEAHLRQCGEWEGDVLHHRRDGTALTVSVRKVLQRDGEGQPPVVLESARDVTALRDAEARLRVLNQHLEIQVRAEVAARQAAQTRAAQAERMEALGQLAGGIAHDFNNVLQAVTGGIAAMERRAPDPGQVKQFARMIREAAARGASVTRRLLVFARRSDLRTEPVEVATLLEGMQQMLRHTLDGSIEVRVDTDPCVPKLLADRHQLETVLVNLATNARDAMPEGGTVTFRARAEAVLAPGHEIGLRPGRYVALAVADTGTGMDAETLARATEPFFTTKDTGKGTGLGLATARGFAEQSRGGLHIDSTPGRGTTVTLYLPTAEAPSHSDCPQDVSQAPTTPFRAHLLLVDDDTMVRESLAAGLADMGHTVQVANSSETALALVRDGVPVDCLLTDLSMPGMNGVALVHAVRKLRPGLPAVVLTGYAAHSALAGADACPTYALLWKPTDPARVARRIVELLSGEPNLVS